MININVQKHNNYFERKLSYNSKRNNLHNNSISFGNLSHVIAKTSILEKELIPKAIEILRNAGINKLPNESQIIVKELPSIGRRFEQVEPNDPCLYINSLIEWSKITPVVEDLYKAGVISTKNPLHPILHGFGHWLHRAYNPDIFYQLIDNKIPLSIANKQIIEESLGKAAALTPCEFVAETFVKLINNEKISDDLLKLYKKYGGVIPNIQT